MMNVGVILWWWWWIVDV